MLKTILNFLCNTEVKKTEEPIKKETRLQYLRRLINTFPETYFYSIEKGVRTTTYTFAASIEETITLIHEINGVIRKDVLLSVTALPAVNSDAVFLDDFLTTRNGRYLPSNDAVIRSFIKTCTTLCDLLEKGVEADSVNTQYNLRVLTQILDAVISELEGFLHSQ